jgi:hypothetical protein
LQELNVFSFISYSSFDEHLPKPIWAASIIPAYEYPTRDPSQSNRTFLSLLLIFAEIHVSPIAQEGVDSSSELVVPEISARFSRFQP